MNCCCEQSGLGALARVYGLGGLAGVDQANLNNYVLAGSVIEWGGYLEKTARSVTGLKTTYYVKGDEAQALVKPGLWAHGGFDWVDVGQISGVTRPYISIVVTTKTDFAKLRDVLSVIEGAAWNGGLKPVLVNFGVRSVPQNILPGLTPPTGGTVAYPDQQNRNISDDDDDDDDDGESFWDEIMKALDVGKKEAQVIVFGGGALLLVLLTRR